MNIIDAYKLFKNQLIIVISGMSGCKKTKMAKKMASELNLKYINQFDFYKKNYNTTIKLKYNDGNEIKESEVINWDTDESIDFAAFNKCVMDNMKNGLVIAGFSLPTDKLDFTPDVHIHIKISKELCMKKRHDFLEENKSVYVAEYNNIGSPLEKAIMNKLTYPYYYGTLKKQKIDKYIDDIDNDDNTLNSIWDYTMSHVQSFINWFNKNEYSKWKSNTNNITNTTDDTDADNTPDNVDDIFDDEFDDDINDGPVEIPDMD